MAAGAGPGSRPAFPAPVAVWRELRRCGAVPVSPGTWIIPALPVFEPALERAGELARRGGGSVTAAAAAPRDEAGSALFREAFANARTDEWSEFTSDCAKFEAEIAREIGKQKFTLAELEEEEQSLERLRRWYRELKSRDVLHLPQGNAAADHLTTCSETLNDYANQVYAAILP